MLSKRRYPEMVWSCDGIELRADGVPVEHLFAALENFQAERTQRGFKGLVVFTLRLRRDGGEWDDARARERDAVWLALSRQALPPCDMVDIEIEQADAVSPEVWDALQQRPFRILLSHHSLKAETPETWSQVLRRMEDYRPDAVKFAVTVSEKPSVESLLRFARTTAQKFPLCCVIGMGDVGSCTRVISPLLGCVITYAYVEKSAVAPGQLPVTTLRTLFAEGKKMETELRAELRAELRTESEWMEWAQRRLGEIAHAA